MTLRTALPGAGCCRNGFAGVGRSVRADIDAAARRHAACARRLASCPDQQRRVALGNEERLPDKFKTMA